MLQKPIPVTIITGFLGSGKTTLLQKILKEDHGKRIAVIENEFGAIGIDHHLIERKDEETIIVQNGCICCTVRKDLVEAILRLNEKRHLFDSIVIETTGLADPGPVTQTLLTHPQLAALVRIDSIVTVVDAFLFEDNFAEKTPEFQAQIALADLLVMSKSEMISPEHMEKVETQLRKLNLGATILPVTKSNAPIDRIFDQSLFSRKTPRFLPAISSCPLVKMPSHEHSQVFSEVFTLEGDIHELRFQQLLQVFFETFGTDIYRMKGIFKIEGENELTLIQVVRHVIVVDKLPYFPADEILNSFVIIAKNESFIPVFRELLKVTAANFDEIYKEAKMNL